MKHYKIFGPSLPSGLQKVGQTEILVQIIGIVIYAMSTSSEFKEILTELAPVLENSTDFPFPDIIFEHSNTTCGFYNGSSRAFDFCVVEATAGMTGALVHIVGLITAAVLLRFGKERDLEKCSLWLRLTAVLSGIEILIVLVSLIIRLDKKLISFMVLNIIYKSYSMALVRAYTTNSRSYEDLSSLPSSSTSTRKSNSS